MRYQDKELILLREVPLNHFWRADRTLQKFGSFVVSPAMTDRYWEIPEKRMPENSTRLLQRASLELRKNIAVAVWDELDWILRTLLCRAYEEQDSVLIAAVSPLAGIPGKTADLVFPVLSGLPDLPDGERYRGNEQDHQ